MVLWFDTRPRNIAGGLRSEWNLALLDVLDTQEAAWHTGYDIVFLPSLPCSAKHKDIAVLCFYFLEDLDYFYLSHEDECLNTNMGSTK